MNFEFVTCNRCAVKQSANGFHFLNLLYNGSVNWINIVLSVFTYSCIFVKIIRSSIRVQSMKGDQEAAKIMTPESKKMTKKFVIFVLVLVIQWLPLSVYLILTALSSTIPNVLVLAAVIFGNLGGVFNAIIYVAFRKPKVEQARPGASVVQSKA